MIDHLRKKFIKICMGAFAAAFLLLFAAMFLLINLQARNNLDALADIVSSHNGQFPSYHELRDSTTPPPDTVNQESPFTTRFFTVHLDKNGRITEVDTSATASISDQEAIAYTNDALAQNSERGWVNDFRYKRYTADGNDALVFINGRPEIEHLQHFFYTALSVFIIGSLIVLLLVIIFSKRAVRPVAESIRKQKQFITDSGHELKTPLTLIRTNLDLIEADLGSSEWLDDMRSETDTLTHLVNRLIQLARLDETPHQSQHSAFSFSDLVCECAACFAPAIRQRQLAFTKNVTPGIILTGDKDALRQLIGILFDNAVKYTDPKGAITLTLCGGRHPTLTLDNTCATVAALPLDQLFDRFYRADAARTIGSGFGLGLSIAKAISEQHHAQLTALKLNNTTIRLQLRF